MELADYTKNRKAFEEKFVTGAAPSEADQKKYVGLMFRPVAAETPKISDNTATVKVEIEEGATGAKKGVVEWTVEKVGDKWKLKSAPLPP
jgi:hypothetical protein